MSNDELLSRLHQQNVRDTRDRQEWEKVNTKVEGVLAEAKMVTNFRRYFNRWLKTNEGQAIKEELFKVQEGKCFYCQNFLILTDKLGKPIDHSEVHHLAPLAILQRYAKANPHIEFATLRVFVICPKYLRLVHPLCNKKLGEKIGELSKLDFLRSFVQEHK